MQIYNYYFDKPKTLGLNDVKVFVGEKQIEKNLKSESIEFVMEKTFSDCKDKYVLPFDFYLPDINVCIEFNGIQHYKPIDFFGGERSFIIQKEHDKIKFDYCTNNNISFLAIKYDDNIEEKLIEFNIIKKKESV